LNLEYKDILDRLGPPRWWDEHAVPRYCGFRPGQIANIYAEECIYMIVACQGCRVKFKVVKSRDKYDDKWQEFPPHYGDPPNISCCGGGATMGVEFVRIISYWKKKEWTWKKISPPRKRSNTR